MLFSVTGQAECATAITGDASVTSVAGAANTVIDAQEAWVKAGARSI